MILKNNKDNELCNLVEECQPLDIMCCLLSANPSKNCPHFFKIINSRKESNSKYKRDKRKGLLNITIDKFNNMRKQKL